MRDKSVLNTDSNLLDIDALVRVNEILACPFDGRDIGIDPLGYIALLQEAFLYLRNVNAELEGDILKLVNLCKDNRIDASKFTKRFNEI